MVAVAQAGQRVGLGHPPQRHLHALDLEGPVANRADQHHQQQDQQARGLRLLVADALLQLRSEEHTSELQSLMRISYAVLCLKNKTRLIPNHSYTCTSPSSRTKQHIPLLT